jgi:hypothetical protein
VTKANLNLILSQKPVVPTNCAGALCNTMDTSKNLIQEFLDNYKPLC